MNYAPLALVLLAGCASVGDIQSSSIDREDITDKPVAAVSKCLNKIIGEQPISDDDGNPVFVVRSAYGAPGATITLAEHNGGTKLQVRQTSAIVITGWRRRCL